MKMNIKTFLQAQHYLNVSIYRAIRFDDNAVGIRMLCSQKKIAENLEGKAKRSVVRRRKNYAGKYSFRMRQTESREIESMTWYRRHVILIDSKIQQVKSRD